MTKFTKRFDIGEYCQYGSIRVTGTKYVFKVQVCDYKTNNPQEERNFFSYGGLEQYLQLFTTPYYADKIIEYVKAKRELT